MNLNSVLLNLQLEPNDVGEIFVNHSCITDFDQKIPDNARVAIFAAGMHLLCGGQHLKGHGFIQTSHQPMSYWNDISPGDNEKK